MDYNRTTMYDASDTPQTRRRLRLITAILLTVPCYCAGIVFLSFAPDAKDATPTPSATLNAETQTVVASNTPPVVTGSPTTPPTETFTPTATETGTATHTPFQPATLTPSLTPTLIPSNTATNTFTVTPSVTPSNIPTNTFTPTPSITPTNTLTPSPTAFGP